MSQIGKSIRMERIINRKTNRMIIVPMDHGVSSGPIQGLIDMSKTVNDVAEGGANAVLLHKGLIRIPGVPHPFVNTAHRGYGQDIGLIIHLSASTSLGPDPNHKVLVTTVDEAIKLGADAVSIHINIGAEDEAEMLSQLGLISKKCADWGMPLLAMMYPRGKKISSEHDVDVVKFAARAGAELGADIIKTNYTGDIDSFKEVTKGCPVPVIIAGGPKMNTTRDVLIMVKDSIEAGGVGTSIGRNVFQSENPTKLVKAFSMIIHDDASVDEALKEIK